MNGIILPFRKTPEPPPRGRGWVVAITLTGAIILGAALMFSGCAHGGFGQCADTCTPEPMPDPALCVDRDGVRMCGWRINEYCTELHVRQECHGEWEPYQTECDYTDGRHGT